MIRADDQNTSSLSSHELFELVDSIYATGKCYRGTLYAFCTRDTHPSAHKVRLAFSVEDKC